jgi:D-xylose transport system substrate-binding protein
MERLRSIALAAAAVLGATTGVAQAEGAKKVFFLLPNTTTIRFESRDAPLFVKAMKQQAPNVQVVVQNGGGDPTRQQRLVEDAISQGAAVIVLTSTDANLAAGSLQAADKAGVPVVLYDHDAVGGKAAAQIVFDSLAVGQAQGKRAAELISAMNKSPVLIARVKGNQGEYGTRLYEQGQDQFLKPLIDSGKAKVVCEQYTKNWDPTVAQSFAEDCLTKNGGKVDVFIGMNDGTTGGSVAALISQGYKPGEKLVTGGQDATVEALRYIAQGWQDDSVFKDLQIEASKAAEVVASLIAGKGVPDNMINGKVDNQFMNVPAVFLPVTNITASNIGDVVKAGVWTWPEICKGIESTDICKKNL